MPGISSPQQLQCNTFPTGIDPEYDSDSDSNLTLTLTLNLQFHGRYPRAFFPRAAMENVLIFWFLVLIWIFFIFIYCESKWFRHCLLVQFPGHQGLTSHHMQS